MVPSVSHTFIARFTLLWLQGAAKLEDLCIAGYHLCKALEFHTPASADNGSARCFGQNDHSEPNSWSLSKLCLAFWHMMEHWANKVAWLPLQTALLGLSRPNKRGQDGEPKPVTKHEFAE